MPDRDDFDKSQLAEMNLIPVAVRAWNGLLWINLAGDQAGLLGVSLDEFVADVASWNISDMVFNGRVERIFNCNWKVRIDRVLEAYPLPIVHADSIGDEIMVHEARYHHFEHNSSYYLPLKPTRDAFAESGDHVRYGQCAMSSF